MLYSQTNAPDRVGSTTNASDDGIGELANLVGELSLDLASDDGLEVTNDGGEGVGSDGGTDEVVGGREVSDPVTHGLVCESGRGELASLLRVRGQAETRRTDSILEGLRSRVDSDDLGSEHSHAEHVKRLTTNVLLSHVDDAPGAREKKG